MCNDYPDSHDVKITDNMVITIVMIIAQPYLGGGTGESPPFCCTRGVSRESPSPCNTAIWDCFVVDSTDSVSAAGSGDEEHQLSSGELGTRPLPAREGPPPHSEAPHHHRGTGSSHTTDDITIFGSFQLPGLCLSTDYR